MNSAATNERIWNPRRGHIFRKTDGALASFWGPLCYRYKYNNNHNTNDNHNNHDNNDFHFDILTFEISKNMFPGIFIGFDICNLKLFALKNRSSIVPSLQNIKNIQFLTILMSKMTFSNKCRKIILTGVEIRKKIR